MKVKDQAKIDNKKSEIISVARDIMLQEGIEQLSIRKIASRIKQTPGIIYHYFNNKEEILDLIVEQGYQNIIEIIRIPTEGTVEEIFVKRLQNYIYAMLEDYQIFQIVMNSTSPNILKKVAFLTPGNRSRASISMLCTNLQQGCDEGVFLISDIELRAQVIMSATYGLMQRIVIEQPHNKERIIEEHIQMLLQSIKV